MCLFEKYKTCALGFIDTIARVFRDHGFIRAADFLHGAGFAGFIRSGIGSAGCSQLNLYCTRIRVLVWISAWWKIIRQLQKSSPVLGFFPASEFDGHYDSFKYLFLAAGRDCLYPGNITGLCGCGRVNAHCMGTSPELRPMVEHTEFY